MVKKLKRKAIVICLLIIITLSICVFVYPFIYANKCKNKFYPEINDMITEDLKNSCVSFMWSDHQDAVTSYNIGSSGVIIKKEENKYYVATANHVVSDKEELRVYPYASLSYRDYIKEFGTIAYSEYFNGFPSLIIEYQNVDDDIAIVSFESENNYPVVSYSNDFNKHDKIFSSGCPNGELFTVTFGEIVNPNEKLYMFSDNKTTNCIKHNCYVAKGSSGSPVFNEKMELIGINIGGKTTCGQFACGYFVKINKVIENL